MFKLTFIILLLLNTVNAQDFGASEFQGLNDDDLTIGGDIFNDFNEDLEDTQVSEDERFYKYGRFFSFQLSTGTTQFNGNRGSLYANDPPTYGLGITYFSDFQSAWGMGFAFSKHSIFIDKPTLGHLRADGAGFVEVSMLRVFFSYRYYIDTSNFGTAITYSNPYFIGRLEYWYTTNKYRDLDDKADDKGGGIGMGIGVGLEFPIKLKETYLNLELLMHSVAFHDLNTREYTPDPTKSEGQGVENLQGQAFTMMIGYVWSW